MSKKKQTYGFGARLGILVFGVASYLIGVTGLVALILGFGNLLPLGALFDVTDSTAAAFFVNFALVSLFGVQHTIMARPLFKAWVERFIPSAMERSLFVLTTGIVAMVIVFFWQPIEGVAWELEGQGVRALFWSVFAFGWSYLLAATFAINHFDLFGLRQVWLAFRGEAYSEIAFKETWMYRFSRHPIMLGVLIGAWSAPSMGYTQLAMTCLFTAYIFIGLQFEERDLIKRFGKGYLAYRARVGMLFTLKSRQPVLRRADQN